MTLNDVRRILEAEVLAGDHLLHKEVKMVCGSDLMSDVLALGKPGALLLTGLTNPQVVRTAEMADLGAICFVRGKTPGHETLELADAKNIPLLTTHLSMFASCGQLFESGLPDCFGKRK